MFGRLRPPSSSSLDSLEMERSSHSKFLKDDSLSVYEATLMKLKLGSQRATLLHPHGDHPMDAGLSPPSLTTTTSPVNSTSQQPPPTTMPGNCSSSIISPASSSKDQVSVLQLFSNYQLSRSRRATAGTMTMMDCDSESENNCPCSLSVPPRKDILQID